MSFDVPGVHPVEIRGKQRGFVATGAGPDLDDGRPVVQRIVRDEQRPEVALESVQLGLQPRDFGPRLLRQLRVVKRNELTRLRELAFGFLEAGSKRDEILETLVFPT